MGRLLALLWIMSVLLLACGGRATPTPQPLPTLPPAPSLDEVLVAQGQPVYETHCASCHGVRGEGQPDWKLPLPDGNYPAPPHDDSGHTWHHGDGTLYQVVRDGPLPRKTGLAPAMPAFGEVLSDEETRAVLVYIRTFWSDETRALQWEQAQRDPFPTP